MTVLREGYDLSAFRADVVAGLTVAVVALPLSMAIAIASGATPAQGLFTSIVGGFIISAFGGSRFQIGGPAGAFIVVVSATISRHGYDGMLLAALIAGLIITAVGALRLGTYIKYVPHPVTVGFTSGIAIIIATSQLKELLGLTLAGPEPGPFLEKIPALWAALPTFNAQAAGLAALTVGLILIVRKLKPTWPAFLIAVTVAVIMVKALGLGVETIGTRFGGIPRSLPAPALPDFSLQKVVAVLPDAFTFALLGGIESLLSAVVADSMTGRRHRSNCELVAQGIANVASSIFGGITATGNIARTATNIRAGARSPVAGMLHSLFLLGFMLVAAPLASDIPLAALAGILIVVAWNMAERAEFVTLIRASRADALVLLSTFGLTVFRDLTEAIVVGVVLGSLVFMHRMSEAIQVQTHTPLVPEDRPDSDNGRPSYDSEVATDPDIVVHRIAGAFFFGASSTVAAVLDRINVTPKAFVLDLAAVPFIDSSGAHSLKGFIGKQRRKGAVVYLAAASPRIRGELKRHGVKPPLALYQPTVEASIAAARKL